VILILNVIPRKVESWHSQLLTVWRVIKSTICFGVDIYGQKNLTKEWCVGQEAVVVHGCPPVVVGIEEDPEIYLQCRNAKTTTCELSAPGILASTEHRDTSGRICEHQECFQGSMLAFNNQIIKYWAELASYYKIFGSCLAYTSDSCISSI
jgi:hypothetical protein